MERERRVVQWRGGRRVVQWRGREAGSAVEREGGG